MSRGAATNQRTEPSTNESEGCKSSQSCEPTLVTHFRVSTSLEYHQYEWDSRSELETIDTTFWTNIKYSLKITNFHEKIWSNFVFFENLLNHCKVLATTKGKRIPQNLLWFSMVKCCSVNISESAAFIFSEMSALSDDWFYWFFVWDEVRCVTGECWSSNKGSQSLRGWVALDQYLLLHLITEHFLEILQHEAANIPARETTAGEHELWDELCCQKHDTRFMF